MLENLQFELPKELIAQEPASPRDHARLLIYDRATKKIIDDHFYNLINYLPDPTCVVVNNSKVEHCRMLFSEGKREIFVLEKANDRTVRALVRPGKLFNLGKIIELSSAVSCTVTNIDEDGIRTLEFSQALDHPDLEFAMHVPLPPYIAQNDELAAEYQTIYAKDLGSKAAPTAGLHFTPELQDAVKKARDWAEITLHVGLGTFAPLTDEQLKTGHLHSETYEVAPSVGSKIKNAPHVTAVGTTSVRTLETIFGHGQQLVGATEILIQPGYEFKRVNSLITNFHLPSTSLLLLVAAFIGSEEELLRIYNHAIKEKYRFYSFGDTMLIL